MAVGNSENFGILDVTWTGQSVELRIRHFDLHGHPYALLSPSRTRELIAVLERVVAGKNDAVGYLPYTGDKPNDVLVEEETVVDPADFEF